MLLNRSRSKAVFILCLFFVTRLYHLQSLPIFTDEALYVRWVNRGLLVDPILEDGQPPLFFFLGSVIKLAFSIPDTLLIIRCLSISFGFMSLIIGMKLIHQLTESMDSAFIFGLLYTTSPIMTIYDRLGMRDSAMVFVFVSSFYSITKWLSSRKRKYLFIAGGIMMIGILIKSIAWFVPIMVGIYLFLIREKVQGLDLLQLFLPLILAIVTLHVFGLFTPLVLKNSIFIGYDTDSIQHLKNNLSQSINWLWQYLTPPIFITAVFSLFNSLKSKAYRTLSFMAISTIPLIVEVFIAKIYFPRYFLISFSGILMIVAICIGKYAKKFPIVYMLLIWQLWFTSTIITNFDSAPLPQIEKWQYVNGWPSGYGVQETAQFIKELNPDYILTEKSDLLRTGISYYQPLLSDKIIPIEDPWSNNLELFGITNEFMKDHKVVAAFHIIKNVPSGYNGKQIFNYIRPGNGDNLVVFEISTP